MLIEKVTAPPVLALPKRGRKYSLDTDASAHQVGYALFQTDEKRSSTPRVLAQTLAQAERNYSVSESECLTVIDGIATCGPYLCAGYCKSATPLLG